MAMEEKPTSCRIGSFVFDIERLVLMEEGGKPVSLKRQSAAVLALLVKNANSVVTRDEIKNHVWQSRTIEYDDGINACIRDIRRALGENPPETRYIETLPKVGYRFLMAPEMGGANEKKQTALYLLGFLIAGFLAFAAFFNPPEQPPSGIGENRLAVMPFRYSVDMDEKLAESLTSKFVAALAEHQSTFMVISAGELFGEDHQPSMADLSRWLEVEYLFAGQVIQGGDAKALNVRLIRTDGYVHLWSKSIPLPVDEVDGNAITELVKEAISKGG